MIYFKTRMLAREFARKQAGYKAVDLGKNIPKRWAVKVV